VTNAARHQIRVRHQPADGQDARHRNPGNRAGPRRRGDRVAIFCCTAFGRYWQILLQKAAIIAARLLPRSLGRVLTIRSLRSGDADQRALTHGIGYARHASAAGGGRATSFASRRRFCAIAARVNSSCAPHGPRNRSRSKASVLARARATSRASSFTSRTIRREGRFGQHFGLSTQARQSVSDAW
jgi:hypothetical protein